MNAKARALIVVATLAAWIFPQASQAQCLQGIIACMNCGDPMNPGNICIWACDCDTGACSNLHTGCNPPTGVQLIGCHNCPTTLPAFECDMSTIPGDPNPGCTVAGSGCSGGGDCVAGGSLVGNTGNSATLEGSSSCVAPDAGAMCSLDALNLGAGANPDDACLGAPPSFGEPINVSEVSSHRNEEDVRIGGALAPLEFSRSYTSNIVDWRVYNTLNTANDTFLPKPFGSSPSDSSALNWSHSLYSYVYPRTWYPDGMWFVRTTRGGLIPFQACNALPDGGSFLATTCFASVPTFSYGSRSQLVWTGGGVGSGHFVLIESDGTRYVYSSVWIGVDGGTPHYFLTQIEDPVYDGGSQARVQVRLNYAVPTVSGGSCPGLGGNSSSGIPYLSTATTFEGAQLAFSYKLLPAYHGAVPNECVLSSVNPRRVRPDARA